MSELVRPAQAATASGAATATASAAGAGVARNAFHLVLGQAATSAMSLVLTAALGRSLGAAEYGLYFLLWSMTAFAYDVATWGQHPYVMREVARRPDASGELLGTALALRVLGALAVAAPAALIARALGYDAGTQALYVALIVAFLPLSLAQTYGVVFRGRERMDQDALVTVAGKALTLAITVLALAAGGRVAAVISSQGAAGLGAVALAAVLYRRLGLPRLRATVARARELLRGGTPLVLLSIGVGAEAYLATVIVSKLASTEVLGWYAAAKNVMNLLITPATILGAAAYPRLSRAAFDPAQFRLELAVAFRPLLWLAALGATGTYLFADVAVDVVYSQQAFGPAASVIRLFAPVLLLLFVDSLVASAVIAAGRPRQLAVGKLLSVLLSGGLGLVLVPICQARFGNGALGVVLAGGASAIAMIGIGLRLLPRGALGPAVLVDAARALLAAGGCLLVMRALPALAPVFAIPVCVLVFAALSAAVGLVRRSDLLALAAAVRRRS